MPRDRLRFGDRTRVMGILNVTPDSFSDGGRYFSREAISRRIEELISAGADIIDVGGESSRPFSEPVSAAQELERVLPAIEEIRRLSEIPVSIDTAKAEVARVALSAGADMINDISALRFDPGMIDVVRETTVPVIIMHMQGTPRDMQIDPVYGEVVAEITAFLAERLDWAAGQGVALERFIVDPGIGFGKTVEHNLSILKHLTHFRRLGCPLLVGHSRKAFIGKILDLDVGDRDAVSAAIAALCAMQGADIVRVHDVAGTVQAVRMAEAIRTAP